MKGRKAGLQLHSPIQPKLTPEQTLEFIENFKAIALANDDQGSTAISIRIPNSLLKAFRLKCEAQDEPYQAQIKELMRKWLM